LNEDPPITYVAFKKDTSLLQFRKER